jgi:hypothetical protein
MTFSARLPVQDINLLKQKLGQAIQPGWFMWMQSQTYIKLIYEVVSHHGQVYI